MCKTGSTALFRYLLLSSDFYINNNPFSPFYSISLESGKKYLISYWTAWVISLCFLKKLSFLKVWLQWSSFFFLWVWFSLLKFDRCSLLEKKSYLTWPWERIFPFYNKYHIAVVILGKEWFDSFDSNNGFKHTHTDTHTPKIK